jgi:hypothetical protein
MNKSYVLVGLSALLIVVLVFFGFMVASFLVPRDVYWHGIEGYYPRLAGGEGGAPDGSYSIYVASFNETDHVCSAAFCPSSPGDLHGYWHYDSAINMSLGMWTVQLFHNVIIYGDKWSG